MTYAIEVYCYGELLDAVQTARLYSDSKTFVDKRLLNSSDVILQKYQDLKSSYNGSTPPRNVLQQFVEENFEDGNELDVWVPPDWTENPSILKSISDPDLRDWASSLNRIWKNLSRKLDDKVKEEPDMYSIIYVPNGFIIPGGRFKEIYYWDTYWIVKGLLLCDMVDTAKGVIENLLYLLRTIGFIPNGSRVYYLERSQPPMLTQMVYAYYKHTNDLKFVKNNIQFLDEEMEFFLNNRTVDVTKNGKTYNLFRYNAPSHGPRPESYREDKETASFATTDDEKQVVYTALKSAAESGWDFSTRWFIKNGTNKGDITDIHTPQIIPVDLNAIMYGNYRILIELYSSILNVQNAYKYKKLSDELLSGINNVLWNQDEGIWLDYDILNDKPRNYFYMSNFVPLWTRSHTFSSRQITKYVLNYIDKNQLSQYTGGTPTSLEPSGEQWDYPNAWPPLQAFLIQGLQKIGTREASDEALKLAKVYLHSNFVGFNDTGAMFEKYDALLIGRTGSGGEYEAQTGFGWTNGFALELLKKYGTLLTAQG